MISDLVSHCIACIVGTLIFTGIVTAIVFGIRAYRNKKRWKKTFRDFY